MLIPSHYWTAPVAALAALALVLLICRWVFAEPRRPARTTGTRGDYGLLVPVATARDDHDAVRLRDRLLAAGIRCTVGEGGQLLVFRSDADRASDLVGS